MCLCALLKKYQKTKAQTTGTKRTGEEKDQQTRTPLPAGSCRAVDTRPQGQGGGGGNKTWSPRGRGAAHRRFWMAAQKLT